MTKRKILIAGGGIGGLATAIALSQRGFKPVVIEKATELQEVGAGIQLSANACHVLNSLNVLPRIRDLAVAPKRIEFRHYHNGSRLFRAPLGVIHRLAFGAPYLHIHRADLQLALAEALNNMAPNALQLGTEISAIEQYGEGVTVRCLDGSHYQGDLLVGADGVRSTVRQICFPEASPPEWTGNYAWRATLPAAALGDQFMPKQATVFVGPGKHMVLYYIRGGRWLNMVGVVEAAHPCALDSWSAKAPWEALRDDFADWHPMVLQVVKAVPPDACYRWDLYRRPVMPHWHDNRVVLMGDAAHATLPFIAQGAALALEDSVVLARCLDRYNDPGIALKTFETLRKPRCSDIQSRADENMALYHGDEAHLMRDFTSHMRAPSHYHFMSNVYRYKANQVSL
ncbi:MAG TPA: FAD-dependent monooxygenase [Pseudomonadales bacterium]|nr:FAD-dependent monooxygenase [Pseudomonadales bacterium]